MKKILSISILSAMLTPLFASQADSAELLKNKIEKIQKEQTETVVNMFLELLDNNSQDDSDLSDDFEAINLNENRIYGKDGIMTVDDVKEFIKGKTKVGAYNDSFVNISTQDPQATIDATASILKWGVSHFLKETIKKYTKNSYLLETAVYMAKIFDKGELHKSTAQDLTRKTLKKNVVEIYDLVLNHFSWENGHSTEGLDFEVAQHLVARERLKSLKAMWK